MQINNKNFLFDYSGKSPAFFIKNKKIKLNNRLIDDLITFSKSNGNTNCRICLHNNKKNKIHSMLVFLNKKNKAEIHNHQNTDEIYHFLRGSFYVYIYKNKKAKKFLVSEKNFLLYRVLKGTKHKIIPKTNYAIFHEIKLNPYNK